MKVRTIRRSLVAIGAVVAVTAAWVAPSTALASNTVHTHAGTESTILEGEQSGMVFKYGEFEVSCSEAKFDGTMAGSEAEAVTLHPVYNEGKKTCTSPFGNTKISTTGCDFVFSGAPLAEESGSIAIECEAEKSIAIEMPLGCSAKIGPQTVSGFTYENKKSAGRNYLAAAIETSELSYTATSICSFGGLPSSGSNGEWANTMTLKGYEDEEGEKGRQTSIWAGTERAFHAEGEEDVTNAVVEGTGTTTTIFGAGGSSLLECGKTTYSGTLEGENEELAAKTLTVQPLYNDGEATCGISTKVSTAGCEFVLKADSPSANVAGVADIQCEEGSTIHYSLSGCTVSMGSQLARFDLDYANQGEGSSRSIAADMDLTGIEYTASGAGCAFLGVPSEGEDGEILNGFELEGYEYTGPESLPGEPVGLWLE